MFNFLIKYFEITLYLHVALRNNTDTLGTLYSVATNGNIL